MIPARRFWKKAALEKKPGGFAIMLDDKTLRGKTAELIIPSRALSDAIRDEWDRADDKINPADMPMFGYAITALDRIIPAREEIIAALTAYGGSDLLCYRAHVDAGDSAAAALRARQDSTWQPYLDYIADKYAARLKVHDGVMPRPQPAESLAALQAVLRGYDSFALAGLHQLVTIPGSLVLGIAVADGYADPEAAMRAALLDDLWQEEKWGLDDEVAARRKQSFAAMNGAKKYLELLGDK